MSKKSIVQREKKRVYLSNNYNLLRFYLKGKILNSSSFREKLFYQSELDNLPRNSSLSRRFCFSLSF